MIDWSLEFTFGIISLLCATVWIIAVLLYFHRKHVLMYKAMEDGCNPVMVKHAFKDTTCLEDFLAVYFNNADGRPSRQSSSRNTPDRE